MFAFSPFSRVKLFIRNSIAWILFITGLSVPQKRLLGHLSIVTFHRVLPEEYRQKYPFPRLVVTPKELDMFLTYFTKHFDCGSLAIQHERYLRGEKTSLPLLAITFDDAQHDNYLFARQVLDKHHLKASFFVPVEAVEKQELLWHDRLGFAITSLMKQSNGGPERLMQLLLDAGVSANGASTLISNIVGASKKLNIKSRLKLVDELVEASESRVVPDFARMMNYEEISFLASEGHEIGSHSMTHCMMTECDESTLKYEIAESRHKLQARLGQPIDTFCYPNGNSDASAVKSVSSSGYSRAVTTTWGSNGRDADPFQLRRFDMVASRVQNKNGEIIPALVAFRMSVFYPGMSS